MKPSDIVYVAGHRGLVGSSITRNLVSKGYDNLLLRTSAELDLCDQQAVNDFFASERPNYVILAAARAGGIHANDTYPAEFIKDNLLIQSNVIDAAHRFGVQKLLFLGSTCIYPKHATPPIPESALLTGALEPTNEWYAVAKIAGIKMCQAYKRQYNFNAISVMPTNLFGPNDNFDLEKSHVIPALLRKFHEAKKANATQAVVWGTGTPKREFLHVDDLADACIFLMQNYDCEEIINIGTGKDISIAELAETIADVVGFTGDIAYDSTKPDGTPRKLVDISKLKSLGWQASIPLRKGLEDLYDWFLKNTSSRRGL